MTNKKKTIIFSIIVAVAIVLNTTLHELLHLLVGRLAGIPAVFLSTTSVGIPESDVVLYPEFNLLLMNSIAPTISVVIGMICYFILKNSTDILNNYLKYFLSWLAIINVPYLGLQLMAIGMPPTYSGSGVDAAAIAKYFNLSVGIRVFIGIAGYGVFLYGVYLLANVISKSHKNEEKFSYNISTYRKWIGYGIVLLSIILIFIVNFSVIFAKNSFLELMLVALLLLVPAFIILIPWNLAKSLNLLNSWLIPSVIGCVVIFPLGMDYAGMLITNTPVLLGIIYLATKKAYT